MTPFGSTHAHWLSSRQLSANQLFDAIAPLGLQHVMKQTALYSAAFAFLAFKNVSSDLVS
jgi:hypothetical protein